MIWRTLNITRTDTRLPETELVLCRRPGGRFAGRRGHDTGRYCPRRLRRRQPEGHRHDRCLYLSRPLRRNRPYRREGADPGAARRRLRRWRDHAAGGTLGAGKLALCQGRRVGPPRSTPRMAVRSQTQAKMRRFFRMLWTQIAYVAPAILIVVAGFVFASQFVRPAPPDRVRSEERRVGTECVCTCRSRA